MNIKSIKYYLVILILAIGYYSYCGITGTAFYQDNVEKNTEFNGNKSHSGTVNRFYHK
ncbi:hypothetical protein [Pedobacter frigidisoli]|uniref:hypothetical protein n=1 Tax=Pedobacter frigidisoli TaxID=2530455 RepID=UPI002930146F|nr:hypothetical protein [Pedobacter frigidisoli]